MKFYHFSVKKFVELKKTSFITMLAVFVSLCCLADVTLQKSYACAIGFTGDMPRQIVLNEKKSTLVDGKHVRELKIIEEYRDRINKEIFYIPLSNGFIDIESYTNDTLPAWLDVEAMNLHPLESLMSVKPGTADYPEFSFFKVRINDHPMEQEPSDCEAAKAYLSGQAKEFPQELWEKGIYVIENKSYEYELCHFSEDGTDYSIMVQRASGNEDLEERDRVYAERKQKIKEWKKENEESYAEQMSWAKEFAAEEGLEMDEEDLVVFFPQFEAAPGESFHTRHTAIVVQVGFLVDGVYVSALCKVGPATSPSDLKTAYDLVQAWKNDFIKVNQ